MDKQLIERAIRDTAAETLGYSAAIVDDETIGFFATVFARIDAERGKDAIGYIEKHMLQMLEEYGFTHTEISNINRSSSRVPLFLSPTIPEGMALVPVEPSAAYLQAIRDAISYAKRISADEAGIVHQAVIAAAQGESQ